MTLLTIAVLAIVALTTPVSNADSQDLQEVRSKYNKEYQTLASLHTQHHALTGIQNELPRHYTSDSYNIQTMKEKTEEYKEAQTEVRNKLVSLKNRTRLREGTQDAITVVISDVMTMCKDEEPKQGITYTGNYVRGKLYKTEINDQFDFVPFIFREDFVFTINLEHEFRIDPLRSVVQTHKIDGTFLQNEDCSFSFTIDFTPKA